MRHNQCIIVRKSVILNPGLTVGGVTLRLYITLLPPGPGQVNRIDKGNKNTKSSNDDDPKWKQQADQIRKSFPPDRRNSHPWSSRARLQGLPKLARVQELVDIAYLTTETTLKSQGLPANSAEVTKGLCIDISQNVARKAFGPLRTHCCSSQTYLFAEDRIMLPHEALRLLGFGYDQIACKNLSGKEVSDLAGNAMAVPSVTLVQMSLLHAAFRHGALPSLFQRHDAMVDDPNWDLASGPSVPSVRSDGNGMGHGAPVEGDSHPQ